MSVEPGWSIRSPSRVLPRSSPPPLHPAPASPAPRPSPAIPRLTLVRAPAEGQLALALPTEASVQLRAAGRAGDHVGLEPREASGPFHRHPPPPLWGSAPAQVSPLPREPRVRLGL